ncbi:MAG: hypothetical protein JNJ88_19425 [Planctomycetes bacterium]|nr:hypothetical protein [Planctomycetota bacterium]
MKCTSAAWIAVLPGVLAAGLLSGCSAAPEGPTKKIFELRGIPGSTSFETLATFERSDLWVKARAELRSDTPEVEVELHNAGPGRITVPAGSVRVRDQESTKECAAALQDEKGDEVLSLVLLAHDRRKLKIRAADESRFGWEPFLVVFRGLRDDRGDGGFDFELSVRVPPEADPEQKPPQMPEEKAKEARRPLYEELRKPGEQPKGK